MNRQLAACISFALCAAIVVVSSTADAQRASPSGNRGHVAGEFDYYALVLSWSPTYCETERRRNDDTQCAPRSGRPFAFVLHGLWPQYNNGFPENCRIRGRPFVPNNVISNMMDIMPSRGLIIHEFRKHGTCSGFDATGYYAMSRQLFQRVRIPKRFDRPDRQQILDRDMIIAEFVAANPGLKRSGIAVVCRGTGNRLREVRICMSKTGKFIDCGRNENQRRLCRGDRVFVPPVRLSKGRQGR